MANLSKPLNQGFAAPSIVSNYGPYVSVAAAHAALADDELNVVGITVGIQSGNTIEEYWYQGGTTQAHLVPKKPDLSGKANKSEMSVTDGTGADSDKTTITLKSGTSATVLKNHQSLANYYMKSEVDNKLADKQNSIDDLDEIRSGAQSGATAYKKPSAGIPSSDMTLAVQTSLEKANTAVQPLALATVATSGSYNDLSNKPIMANITTCEDIINELT